MDINNFFDKFIRMKFTEQIVNLSIVFVISFKVLKNESKYNRNISN